MSIRSTRRAARPAVRPTALPAAPVRRGAALGATLALVAVPAGLLGATPALADGSHGARGAASAAVLRAGLDVGLLDKKIDLPLNLTLNAVSAPRSARQTSLSARLDGVEGNKPFNVLRADVATAAADVDRGAATASSELAHARVHLPGLPLLSLVEVDAVKASVECRAGARPKADAQLPATVRVLGRKVTVSTAGTTALDVPGIGHVRLDLARHSTTSTTAAAAALDLSVEVNPLKLNVAEVSGRVTLAQATCTAPAKAADPAPVASPTPKPSASAAGGTRPQTAARQEASPELAETGAGSTTPYLAGGAALLLALGGGALAATRRRRAAAAARD
ncbi:SCO1860 family LAETG-anchored protein [Streptomyces sp. NPDC059740]|uniref:SCO1860 family LAETG-anchored protein n=1 Tax=Streptomyces sp. NPDC059740 TaxID=3346926 RepID=UPI0036686996